MQTLNYFIFPRLHSFFLFLFAFIVGICTFHFYTFILAATIAVLICAGLFFLTYIFKLSLLDLLAILFFFGAGFFICYHYTKRMQIPRHFYNQPIIMRATILNIEQIDHILYKNTVTLCIQKISTDNNWIPFSYTILIYTNVKEDFLVSDSIQLVCCMKETQSDSYKKYLIKEGISGICFNNVWNAQLLYRPLFSTSRFIHQLKTRILFSIKKKMNRQAFGMFSSIFLGNRTCVKKTVDRYKDSFASWGISHYLARSGLHLVLFILLWHYLLSWLPINFIIKQSIMILLIIIYTIFSWTSVSFLRALLMFFLYKFFLLFYKPTHYLHIILLSCFLILAWNPYQLFFLDFQLSFGLTFALAFFSHMQRYKKSHQ